MKYEISENDLELLSAALDGQCGDQAALRARLNAEPELALRMRQLQAVRARLAALPPPNPPADFAVRVTKRAYARKLPLPTMKFWCYAVPAVAAAMLLIVAGFTHKAPPQKTAAPDGDAWRAALMSLAESPDAETMAEWVGGESAVDEASPNDLVGALADRSAREPGGVESIDAGGFDAHSSVIDVMEQMNNEDAATVAAMLRSGA